jgi:glycosyltransferase involved in cell wall biosynthesis
MSGTRALVASSGRVVPEERFDLLVHVLAQLPDEVTLQVFGDGPDRPRLERLACAYRLSERLHISPAPPAGGSCQVVHPSLLNAATAPIQSIDSITLDASAESVGGGRPGLVNTLAELVAALSRDDDPPASLRADPELLAGERVAIVTNHPAPYRVPLFEQIAERVEGARTTFRVFFLARAAADRAWMRSEGEMGFEHTFLRSVQLPFRKRPPAVPLRLEGELDRFSPTILVAGGFSPFVALRLARYAHRRQVTLGLWSGEHGAMGTAKSRPRLRERRWLANRASFGISYGSRSAEYLRQLRSDLPVVYGRNTSTFPAPRMRREDARELEILTVGDLASPRKGIDVLIDALAQASHLRCRLTVVGGGKLLPDLRKRASGDRRVRFLGALPPDRVRELYGQADVFAFPSRADVFGLAPVEAMGAGLATIVAAAPGMVADLCVHGRNSLVIDGDDPASWAAGVECVVLDADLRARLAAEGARTIERRWTVEHSAGALIAGLRLGVLTRAHLDPMSCPDRLSSREEERPSQALTR